MSNNNDNVAHASCVVTAPALILDAPANHLHATGSHDVSSISVETDKFMSTKALMNLETCNVNMGLRVFLCQVKHFVFLFFRTETKARTLHKRKRSLERHEDVLGRLLSVFPPRGTVNQNVRLLPHRAETS